MTPRSAPARLWQALARGDWDAMEAQFAPEAPIEDAAGGRRRAPREWVAEQRVAGSAQVRVERLVAQSNDVAVEVVVERAGVARRCAAFYDLRDGRIARAVEYWAEPAGG